MPYGAALIGEYESASARDEIAIAAIGPACNFFLLLITVATWWLCPAFYDFTACFAAANLCLVVVNLLPVFPLDGGRILLAALSRYRSRSVALKKNENRFVRVRRGFCRVVSYKFRIRRKFFVRDDVGVYRIVRRRARRKGWLRERVPRRVPDRKNRARSTRKTDYRIVRNRRRTAQTAFIARPIYRFFGRVACARNSRRNNRKRRRFGLSRRNRGRTARKIGCER